MSQVNTAQSRTHPPQRMPRQSIPANIDPLLREPARREATGVSRSAWNEMEKQGLAPARVRIGLRAVAWRTSDLMRWVDARQSCGAVK